MSKLMLNLNTEFSCKNGSSRRNCEKKFVWHCDKQDWNLKKNFRNVPAQFQLCAALILSVCGPSLAEASLERYNRLCRVVLYAILQGPPSVTGYFLSKITFPKSPPKVIPQIFDRIDVSANFRRVFVWRMPKHMCSFK